MILRKHCPRCEGDLVLAWDGYGAYLSCIHCGFLKDLPDSVLARVKARLNEAEEPAVAAAEAVPAETHQTAA